MCSSSASGLGKTSWPHHRQRTDVGFSKAGSGLVIQGDSRHPHQSARSPGTVPREIHRLQPVLEENSIPRRVTSSTSSLARAARVPTDGDQAFTFIGATTRPGCSRRLCARVSAFCWLQFHRRRMRVILSARRSAPDPIDEDGAAEIALRSAALRASPTACCARARLRPGARLGLHRSPHGDAASHA